MRKAETILNIVNERGQRGLPLEGLYRLLFQRDLYLRAYAKLYRNAGAMTRGVTPETVDGMSVQKIEGIIEALRATRAAIAAAPEAMAEVKPKLRTEVDEAVRARWQQLAAMPPPGRMKSFSGGSGSLKVMNGWLSMNQLMTLPRRSMRQWYVRPISTLNGAPSTRTRVSFDVGMRQLGHHVHRRLGDPVQHAVTGPRFGDRAHAAGHERQRAAGRGGHHPGARRDRLGDGRPDPRRVVRDGGLRRSDPEVVQQTHRDRAAAVGVRSGDDLVGDDEHRRRQASATRRAW